MLHRHSQALQAKVMPTSVALSDVGAQAKRPHGARTFGGGLGAALVLAFTGCGAPVSGDPDASVVQDTVPGRGIVITLKSTSELPGRISENLRITYAGLMLKSLRLTGDAAPVDANTQLSNKLVEWKEGKSPGEFTFDQAPPGNYAAIETRIDADFDDGIEITGYVRFNDNWIPFEIEDNEPFKQSLPSAFTHLAGSTSLVEVTVGIPEVIKAIDFTRLRYHDGRLALSSGSERDRFRANMRQVFVARPIE